MSVIVALLDWAKAGVAAKAASRGKARKADTRIIFIASVTETVTPS
jgi:hypothetical protein